jgi:hypothetical protein
VEFLVINLLTPELNPFAQRCLSRFFTGDFYAACRNFLLGILIFKVLTARRLYKSFGVKGLKRVWKITKINSGKGK